MDRRLKERLIGATILVVLIVLIVPELLSGPKKPALPVKTAVAPLDSGNADVVRNVTVDLTTASAVATPSTQAAVPPSDAPGDGEGPVDLDAEAAPTALAGGRKAPPTVTTLRAQRPASGGESASARDAEIPEVSRHAWAVQVGSFASRPNAEKLVRHLHLQFPSVGLSSGGSGAALRYRVRVGPLADRAAAEQALAKLKAQRYQVSLVTPSP